MPRVAEHLSWGSQRGLSIQGALLALAFGMIGLVYGGFATMKMISPLRERDAAANLEPDDQGATCASRMMQIGTEVYDPNQISCVIPQSQGAIWGVHARWDDAKRFADREAKWIGPGALQQRPDGTEYCPDIMGTETLLYARTLTVPQAVRAKLELLVDEDGRVTVEHLESKRILLDKKTRDQRFTRSLTLPRGTVRILVEASDRDTSTAMLFSLRGNDKRPLALSGEAGWCIFRLDSPSGLPVLLDESARCHPCLGGLRSSPL